MSQRRSPGTIELCEDEQRLAVLHSYGILDTPPEAAFDDLARLAAQVCETPIALVSFVDRDRQWFKSEFGFGRRQTPLDLSICRHVLREEHVFVSTDLTKDVRFATNPLVTGNTGLRFYAGSVLRSPEGQALGTLCVLDRRPRDLTPPQRDGLRALAREVVSELELRRAQSVRDGLVTGKRDAEEALREGQIRLDAVVAHMTEGLVLCDPDGALLSMNPAALAIHQFPSTADMLQRLEQYPDLFELRDLTGVPVPLPQWPLSRALRGERFVGLELQVTRKDTGHSWVGSYGGTPVRGAGGKIELVVLNVSDITERGRGERLLAEQKRVLEMIAASAPVADILAAITRLVEQQSSGDLCSILLLDDSTQRLHLGAAPSLPAEYNAALEGLLIGDGVGSCGTAAFTKKRIIVSDIEHDPLWKDFKDLALHHGLRACWSHPILGRDGQVLGTVANYCLAPGEPNEQHLQLLAAATHLAGIAIDNADLLRQLREGEAKFRQLANSVSQLVWMANPDGHIFWYNDQWYRYTGCTPREMEGWGWQKVHDPAVLPKVLERWEASLEAGEPFEMEFPLRSAQGEFRSFLTRVNPLRAEDGKIVLWFGTNTDVTEWRRQQEALAASEARLRAVLEATPESVSIVLPDGSLSYVNPAGLVMMEADGLAVISGARVVDFIAAEHREQWEQNHRRVCAGERISWAFEMVGLRGTRRWMEKHAVPLPLPDGRNAQLAVTRDVTQRRQAELQRETLLESEREARAQAERLSRMKDEFLATLSHELRTPLNAILGWAHLLQSGQSSEEDLSQGLATIERNARTQSQIIEDLLDMSRIVSGKVRLDVQRVDLITVLEAAIQTARPAADFKEIRIQPVLDPLAGPVSGDPNRLQQVFWNLLNNAVKFTPKGGRVQVLLERVNSHLEVSVIDTGEGIRPDFLPYVFDRFRQADASTTRRHGGLGLGLAIVKQLVELHGGTVRAKSAGVDKGTTFVVTLPLTILHPDETPEGERRHPTSSAAAPDIEACRSLEGVRVLVVDDEPDARGLVQRLLTDCDARVTAAPSASEALARLEREVFDVLVSDIGMPGEDGYSLIRRVRKLDSPAAHIPALALTAYARSEDRQRAIRAGYNLHVAKPVEPSELITMVSSLAGRLWP